jgi:cephalosporin hydroxylase
LSLLQILQAQKPKFLCEIGTASGGTLYLFSKVASRDASLISVDLPGGAFGAGYQKSKMQFLEKFASAKQKIFLVRDDSHSERARLNLENLLNGRKLDFLLIDGDHSYNGVKADFMTYRSLVGKGGLIAFHDIVPGDPRFVGGVPKFWAEIKVDFKHAEFVDSWNQGGAGIGVLWNE